MRKNICFLSIGTAFFDPDVQPGEVYVVSDIVSPKGGGPISTVLVRNLGKIKGDRIELYTSDWGYTSYNTSAEVVPIDVIFKHRTA